jgi:hypothetical protein
MDKFIQEVLHRRNSYIGSRDGPVIAREGEFIKQPPGYRQAMEFLLAGRTTLPPSPEEPNIYWSTLGSKGRIYRFWLKEAKWPT